MVIEVYCVAMKANHALSISTNLKLIKSGPNFIDKFNFIRKSSCIIKWKEHIISLEYVMFEYMVEYDVMNYCIYH